jgi:MFS family permease
MSSGSIIGPILGGITLDFLGLQAPFLISILVELSLIPIYLFAIYLIKPRLTESFEENENIAIEKI